MASVAEAIGKVVPCSSVSAFVLDTRRDGEPETTQAFFKGHEQKTLLEYASHYMRLDPMGADIVKAAGVPSLLSDYVPHRTFGRDAYTGDFLQPLGVRHIMGVTHLMPDGAKLAFALQRVGGQDDFAERERELLRVVVPHVSRAAFLATFRERIASLSPATTSWGRAGGLLARGGQVVHADPDAMVILAALGDGNTTPEATFAALNESVVPEDAPAGSVFKRMVRLREGLLALVQLCVVAHGRDHVLGTVEVLAPGSRAAFDTVADGASLSRREREVAALAMRGEGNRSIASHLGISPPTIGVVLSRVYRKLGVAGRTEMASLLLGYPRGGDAISPSAPPSGGAT
jgi:DNA-binding CsgD family transcriptional regulator